VEQRHLLQPVRPITTEISTTEIGTTEITTIDITITIVTMVIVVMFAGGLGLITTNIGAATGDITEIVLLQKLDPNAGAVAYIWGGSWLLGWELGEVTLLSQLCPVLKKAPLR
jgi:hypothetical protein